MNATQFQAASLRLLIALAVLAVAGSVAVILTARALYA